VRLGDPAEARRRLAVAERAAPAGPLPDGSTTLRPWLLLVRAAMCADGAEQMLTDAQDALVELPADSFWQPTALLLQGTALALLGDLERADATLDRAADAAETIGAADARIAAISQRALIAADVGDQDASDRLAQQARHAAPETAPERLSASVLPRAILARTLLRRARPEEAREELTAACRLVSSLPQAFPWLAVQARVELTRAFLTLRETENARAQLSEAVRILAEHPGLGTPTEHVNRLRRELAEAETTNAGGTSGLSRAELRLLPLLASHLSFREIGEEFSVTRNTVKSQAISIYRKLGATGRSEAIDAALRLGLIEPRTRHLGAADASHEVTQRRVRVAV